MIGDPYFQLRAQVGTALFSLLRLATEAGASESVQAALRTAQNGLRESFFFLALGPSGSGKSTFLNALFEREFCVVRTPDSVSRIAIFQYGEEERETPISTEVVVVQRPHSFLRDFTVVDTPGCELLRGAAETDLTPQVAQADAIFFVAAAGVVPEEAWKFLSRLGREALKRTIFVAWQSDRVPPAEATQAVKRLRQAMLKNLGQACPIFPASAQDSAGREKLIRWLESEVIFSTLRRTRLDDLNRLAEEALRDIAARPRAAEESWHWAEERLRGLRDKVSEREEQTERQIAGAMWTLAQDFDGLRLRGETLLRAHLPLLELVRDRGAWRVGFARDMETQTRQSFEVQLAGALDGVEGDLREAETGHRQDCRESFGEEVPGDPPPFPRAKIAEAVARAETPLELEQMLPAATTRASRMLRLPVFGALGAVAVALGALPVLGLVAGAVALAAGTLVFVWLLAVLLREQVVATFGAHFTTNRAALLTAIEAPLRGAGRDFYATLARPIEGRLSVHAAERHRHEPLLERIQQLEETFSRIDAPLRASVLPPPPPDEATAPVE